MTVIEAQADYERSHRRRGIVGQRRLRSEEQASRVRAAQLVTDRGLSLREGAHLLGIAPSTLWDWARLATDSVKPLGRKPKRGTPAARDEVLGTIVDLGVGVGLPRLAALHPTLPRAEVRELLIRCRDHEARRAADLERVVLEWRIPGSVWATDFTRLDEPHLCQSSLEPLALVVRDLAANRVLAVEPAYSENAELVQATLERLFRQHGAPLVLKSDNGSGYVAAGFKRACEKAGVVLLFNPPRTPGFNGAAEAYNAWLKRDLATVAAQVESEVEVADLLEAARQLRNRTNRPWGVCGPTPDERWGERDRAVCDRLRRGFKRQVEREIAEERRRLGFVPDAVLNHKDDAAIARQVIRHALVERGILVIRRRGVSP